jgi:hypothetical protein
MTAIRVHCLSGFIHDIATPLSFGAFWKCVKADGYLDLSAIGVIVPWHAIGQLTLLKDEVPLVNVATQGSA